MTFNFKGCKGQENDGCCALPGAKKGQRVAKLEAQPGMHNFATAATVHAFKNKYKDDDGKEQEGNEQSVLVGLDAASCFEKVISKDDHIRHESMNHCEDVEFLVELEETEAEAHEAPKSE